MNGPREVEPRLGRIEGQVRAIRSMIADGRSTVDVVTQVLAVNAALKRVVDLLVANHVEEWLAQAVSGNGRDVESDPEELFEDIQSVLSVTGRGGSQRMRRETD
jgi:DNA-binding FrmR family transcriptional regulator